MRGLLQGTVIGADGLDETVHFSSEFLALILKFFGINNELRMKFADVKEMLAGFIARRVRINQKFEELVFILASAITLDDICRNRFGRAPELAFRLIHLKLGQTQRQTMAIHPKNVSQSIHLQISIRINHSYSAPAISHPATYNSHPASHNSQLASCISHPASRILYPVSSKNHEQKNDSRY